MSLGHPFMFNILPGTIMTYYFTTSPLWHSDTHKIKSFIQVF